MGDMFIFYLFAIPVLTPIFLLILVYIGDCIEEWWKSRQD